MKQSNKIIIILGPTAAGKTSLAIKLAKKFNGEIISADSRQIYKYMKIGTDVPDGDFINNQYIVKGVIHHLMNCIEPDKKFTLADFKEQATSIIKDIISRGKVPFIVGGTGLYISSIVDNLDIPKVKPDMDLRKKLEKKSLDELVELLKEKDLRSYKVIDIKNYRRVLRALEVVISSGESFITQQTKSEPEFNCLQIGIMRPRDEIYQRINTRIDSMIEMGIIDEVKNLLKKGYSWNLNSMSGLGYRQFRDYLGNKASLEESIENLKRDTRHYAKRQISWFKRDERIYWLESNSYKEAEQKIVTFLK